MEAALNGPMGHITLGPTALTIGRMPGNQVLMTDPQSSSHHAEIRPEGQGYSIIDLGSTNGTFVNEQQLASHVSRILVPGDTIRIGSTVFTYEASGLAPIAPTIYVGPPGKGNAPVFEPTVAAPPLSPAGYGANVNYASNDQRGYQQPPQPPPPPSYQPYPAPDPRAYAPAPARKKRRRGLWITLIILLLIAGIIFGAVSYINRSTPARTLTAFCNDLKARDYHDAYQQLSSRDQRNESEDTFAKTIQQGLAPAGGMKDCSFSNESDNGSSSGTFIMTWTLNLSLIQPVNFNGTLVNESGVWKIDQLNRQK
jgi:hypothetical protein